MDQPTAEGALYELARLIGEWTLEAIPPGGEPWPGEARVAFDWLDSGAHLIERSTVDVPGAPNTISIIGCDAANGTFYQLYSDDRGVCRVYPGTPCLRPPVRVCTPSGRASWRGSRSPA